MHPESYCATGQSIEKPGALIQGDERLDVFSGTIRSSTDVYRWS